MTPGVIYSKTYGTVVIEGVDRLSRARFLNLFEIDNLKFKKSEKKNLERR
jgi:hypothetical protein